MFMNKKRTVMSVTISHILPHEISPSFSRHQFPRPVFLNLRAAVRYRTLASITPGHERPEETTICCKISLVL